MICHKDTRLWLSVFAWLPVQTFSKLVWLEEVWCRKLIDTDIGFDHSADKFEYTEKEVL